MNSSNRSAPIIFVVSSFVLSASAQRLSLGVVGGTSVTSDFPTTDFSNPAAFGNPANRFQLITGPRSFIFGALLELPISEELSIETNALRRPMRSTITFTEFPAIGPNVVSTHTSTMVTSWEFPVLLKYRLPSTLRFAGLRPFVEAGPSFRTNENASAVQPSQYGFSVGAGIAFRLGKFRIAPAMRYTRWASESIYPRYATKPDQLELLTSFAYETDQESRHLGFRKIDVGTVFGVPLTSGFSPTTRNSEIAESFRYLAGGTAQVNLVSKLSLEIDALYRPLRASQVTGRQERFSVLTWEFPVLAKYRWTKPLWTPFAEAGPSFRLAGNLNGYNPSHTGITLGGGVETHRHGLGFAPALRYTRWTGDNGGVNGSSGFGVTNSNSVELVFALTF